MFVFRSTAEGKSKDDWTQEQETEVESDVDLDLEVDGWGEVPTVILVEVLRKLPSVTDRLSAASVCRTWRLPAFQVPLRDTLALRMLKGGSDVPKVRYLAEQFSRKVSHVAFTFDLGLGGSTKNPKHWLELDWDTLECLDAFSEIFSQLEGNRELKSLKIQCSEVCLTHPLFQPGDEREKRELFTQKMLIPLQKVLQGKNQLESFSFPLIQNMSSFTASSLLNVLLNCRNASNLSKLSFPTFKYSEVDVDVSLKYESEIVIDNGSEEPLPLPLLPKIKPTPDIETEKSNLLELIRTDIFQKLQMLSIGHDYLTDEILGRLGVGSAVGGLKQLNLIAVKANPNVSFKGWSGFVENNSDVKVRLTVCGGSGLMSSKSNLVFGNIPLTHIRTYHSKKICVNFLSEVVGWNFDTLEHLELVDDDCDYIQELTQLEPEDEEDPDPNPMQLVDPILLAAWRCEKLHTIKIRVLYEGDNLVGIARLKGPRLHLLEIPKSHVIYDGLSVRRLNREVSTALKRPWRPIKSFKELSRTKCQRERREEEAALVHTLRSAEMDELWL